MYTHHGDKKILPFSSIIAVDVKVCGHCFYEDTDIFLFNLMEGSALKRKPVYKHHLSQLRSSFLFLHKDKGEEYIHPVTKNYLVLKLPPAQNLSRRLLAR